MFSLYSHGISGVVFTPPVGYSRPPSAVNDPTVIKQVNGGVEDVVSVLTLVRRGAAQVCHVLHVEELREQLEVEEEDGGQTGGRGRSRKWRGRIKESAPCWWPWMEVKCAQNLSHEMCV